MTQSQREFTLTRDLDAPRDLVFSVWTDPEHMGQWLMPVGVFTPQETISADLKVGGYWRWTMIDEQDGSRYPTVAQFREIVDSERLVFTWGGEDSQPAVITVTFAEHGDGTRLTLHLVGPADFVTEESEIEDGWSQCLDSLQRFLDRTLESR